MKLGAYVGLAGLILVTVGVFVNFGVGWALTVLGLGACAVAFWNLTEE